MSIQLEVKADLDQQVNNLWANLHCHSDGSLLDGLSKPIQIIERCVELGIPACALTDHGSISNIAEFISAKKEYTKKLQKSKDRSKDQSVKDAIDLKIAATKKIKQINGCELYIGEGNKPNSHLVVLAKNLAGWKSLMKIVSEGSRKENFFRKPRLSLDQLDNYAKGNIIAFSGHLGSDMANIYFDDPKIIYNARTLDVAQTLVSPDGRKRARALADKFVQIFGKENFYIEIQRIDEENLPIALVVAQENRMLAQEMGLQCVATADAHYPKPEDARDQRVLLCTAMNTTMPKVHQKMITDPDDVGLAGFFRSSNYHIPSLDRMRELHTPEELANSLAIADMCEDYNIIKNPVIPSVECPDNLTPDEYLRILCRQGWKTKVVGKVPFEHHKEYGERVKTELAVFEKAKLAGYFLILCDIANFVKSHGKYCGVGRGSAAGCLVSKLIGITALDPIEYDLLFERFYNEGRNTEDHISLPDIDFDVQASFRDETIAHVKKKFGKDKVGQICTFGRMMGRGVIKDVLRAHEACSFDEMNKITEFIPDEAEIADQLQVMREEEGESSIIKWALENNSKELRQWAYIDKNGEVAGEYAEYFKQAMRLEGTRRSMGKHAAGIVISPEPLEESMPVIYDRKTDEPLIAVDMHSVEKYGGVKLDILGISVLDKLQRFDELMQRGY